MMGPDGSLLLLDRTNQRSFGDRNAGRERAASVSYRRCAFFADEDAVIKS